MKSMTNYYLFWFFVLTAQYLSCFIEQNPLPNSVVDVIATEFNEPNAIAITPNGQMAYICNQGSNTVSVIDTTTNTLVEIIADTSFNYPIAIAITPNGSIAYVANYNGNSVTVINLATNLVERIVIDTDFLFNGPISIAFTPDGLTAYVVNNTGGTGPGSVSVINVITSVATGFISDARSTIKIPFSIAITPSGTTAYLVNNVGDSGYGSVSIIDLTAGPTYNTVTGVVFDSTSPSSFSGPNWISITPNGNSAYVVNSYIGGLNQGGLVVIDLVPSSATYNHVLGTVADANNTMNNPLMVAITPDNTTAYVPNYNGNTVSIIDVASNKVTGTIVSGEFYAPNPIAITSDGQTAYVGNVSNNTVSVISTSSVATTPIQPPSSIQIQHAINHFLNRSQLINILRWTVAATGPQAVKYAIYKDAALTQLIATVQAGSPLEYYDYITTGLTQFYSYYIVSIDVNNNVSAPINRTVKI